MFESCQRLLACNRPTSSERRSVSNYLHSINPVHEDEQEYVQHKEDLVTLRPGREHAFLDQCIEKCLHLFHGKVGFVQVSFRQSYITCDLGVSLTTMQRIFADEVGQLDTTFSKTSCANRVSRQQEGKQAARTKFTTPESALIYAQASSSCSPSLLF